VEYPAVARAMLFALVAHEGQERDGAEQQQQQRHVRFDGANGGGQPHERQGPGHVGGQLRLEGVDRIESLSVAQAVKEVNVERAAVERAGKADQVGLDADAGFPERDVRTDMHRGGVRGTIRQRDAGCIDAGRWQQRGDGREVGGRKPDRTAALRPFHDRTGESIGRQQQVRSQPHLSGGDQPADP
jgi:hypothetical protein